MGSKSTPEPQQPVIKFANTNLIAAQDGAVVSTRKQFKVSREKHNGISWVNSTSQEASGSGVGASSGRFRVRPASAAAPAPTDQRRRRKNAARRDDPDEENDARRSPSQGASSSSSAITPPNGPIDPGLPPWTSINSPLHLPDRYKRLFWITFSEAPPKLYPFHKYGVLTAMPTGDHNGYMWTVKNVERTQMVVTLGVIFDTLSQGKTSSPEMATLVGQLCSMINERLAKINEGTGDHAYYNDTIACINVLAVLSIYVGELNHWHAHMKALRHITEVNGGQRMLTLEVKSPVHKIDLSGALATASEPYMRLVRVHQRLPIILSPERLAAIARTLGEGLRSCGASSQTITKVVEVAIFQDNWSTARRNRSAIFHADSMIEEFTSLQYDLVMDPDSLWITKSTRGGARSGGSGRPTPSLSAPAVGTGLSQQPTPTSVKREIVDAFERSLRIAVLLFLREGAIDPALDRGAYGTLLGYLYMHLRTVLAGIIAAREMEFGSAAKAAAAGITAMRPALLWICLLGDAIQVSNNVHIEDDQGPDIRQDASTIFRRLLRELMSAQGGAGTGSQGTSLTKKDREFLQALDLRIIRGDQWEAKMAVGRVLSDSWCDYEYRAGPRETDWDF